MTSSLIRMQNYLLDTDEDLLIIKTSKYGIFNLYIQISILNESSALINMMNQ